MTKLPPGLSYEGKVEHIIERIVLETIPPDCASPADIRAAIREFCKALPRLNKFVPRGSHPPRRRSPWLS